MNLWPLVLALTTVSSAQSILDFEDLTPGQTGIVIRDGGGPSYLAKSVEGGKLLAKCKEKETSAGIAEALRSKAIVRIPTGLHVGVLQTFTIALDENTSLNFMLVRVHEGPLKGSQWYTPWVHRPQHFFGGEPVVTRDDDNRAIGAFDESNIASFDDAVDEGDKQLARGYIALGEIIWVPNGSRGVVEEESGDMDYIDSGSHPRVRLVTGPKAGCLVYMQWQSLASAYDLYSEKKHRKAKSARR